MASCSRWGDVPSVVHSEGKSTSQRTGGVGPPQTGRFGVFISGATAGPVLAFSGGESAAGRGLVRRATGTSCVDNVWPSLRLPVVLAARTGGRRGALRTGENTAIYTSPWLTSVRSERRIERTNIDATGSNLLPGDRIHPGDLDRAHLTCETRGRAHRALPQQARLIEEIVLELLSSAPFPSPAIICRRRVEGTSRAPQGPSRPALRGDADKPGAPSNALSDGPSLLDPLRAPPSVAWSRKVNE